MALARKAKSTTFLEDNKEENICSLEVKRILRLQKASKNDKIPLQPSMMTKLKKKNKRWTIPHGGKK